MAERLILTDTVRPLRLRYDASNVVDFVVSSAGALTVVVGVINAIECDTDNTAGVTRLLVGIGGSVGLTRVRVGAAGSGPGGGTARALYVDYGA